MVLLSSLATQVGLLVLLFICPILTRTECIFGPENLLLLQQRNATIISIMNNTLLNYTNVANTKIGNVLGVTLWSYLQQTYSVTPVNYLDFVSNGKLWAINWTVVISSNQKVNQSLASYLLNDYSTPLHENLQELATNYSFSYGIFRPNQTRFPFTGIVSEVNGSSLDPTCNAGTSFLWRLSTKISYSTDFNNSWSEKFAALATTLENAFSEYYRKPTSLLSREFVRANLLYTSMSSGMVIPFLETYFLNASLQNSTLMNLTNISQLPAMTFDNGTGVPGPFVISSDPKWTLVVLVSYLPVLTNSTFTITQTTKSTTIGGLSSTFRSNVTNSTNSATAVTTSSTSTTVVTSPQSSNTSLISGARFVTNLTSTNSPISTTTVLTNLTASDSSNLSTKDGTTTPTLRIEVTSSTLHLSSAPTMTSISPNMTLTNFQTSPGLLNMTTIGNYSLPKNTLMNVTTSRLSTMSSLSNQTNKTGRQETSTEITFDPDPLFKATAPVITKIYNDKYLLRMKIGTITPLTQNAAFLSVTIPAAIGIAVIAIVCMLCWQVNWTHGSEKL